MTKRNGIFVMAMLMGATALSGCTTPVPEDKVVYDPFKRYPLGEVQDCKEAGTVDVRSNTYNSATPGLGCSHHSNITVMVADPSDFQNPRTRSAPDPVARERVLTAYREGTRTTAAPDAEGSQELIQ